MIYPIAYSRKCKRLPHLGNPRIPFSPILSIFGIWSAPIFLKTLLFKSVSAGLGFLVWECQQDGEHAHQQKV